MSTAVALLLAAIVTGTAGSLIVGRIRWQGRSRRMRATLTAARRPGGRLTYDSRETDDLPAPVQRYFRTVLQTGQPIVSTVHLRLAGRMNLGEVTPRWVPFHSTQLITTCPPGFDWEASLRIVPGLSVRVHDAYIAGEGILRAELLSLIPVADSHGTPAAASGELLRYLAEAVWHPTSLLPSQGVRWEPVSDLVARATLTDRDTTVSLDFQFDAAGCIASVRATARIRKVVNGVAASAPWTGRFWNYARRDGMLIPLEGEVAWELATGVVPYWRGMASEVEYEFVK